MSQGEHRQPARGGFHLTKEQLALLTILSVIAAVFSATTDVFGVLKGDPSPAVSTANSVNATETGSPRRTEDYQRAWIETAQKVCANTYARDYDTWRNCYNAIAIRGGLSLFPAIK
ncbi:hypothetical protein ABT061_21860 [Streptosporangium sp. NPDC002544]|uniref:hypothetical protein n=1 Tax=Streptosporangium sp. NPDC002544 TaxID=3154538 RepID=UPI003334127B